MDLFACEAHTLASLASNKSFAPKVIYDIGASNGVWSDTIALTVPKAEYHLFEPLADHVEFYRRDLDERLRRRPGFHLHAVALSDRSGTAEMFATHDAWGSSMLDRGEIPEVKSCIRVPMRALDEYVAERGLPGPDVIKIDVQGAERLILSGAGLTLRSARVLFLETWLMRAYGPHTPLLPEMIDFLAERGFALVDLGEQFRDEYGRLYSVDAVFFSTRLLPAGEAGRRKLNTGLPPLAT